MNHTIEDKIAQMLLVGIPNRESIPGVLDLIKNKHIGGVILYKNNYNSLKEMIDLINELKLANYDYDIPLTIAIDKEGGRVNRLPKEIINIKSAYRLAEMGEDVVQEASDLTSKILNQLGINMNFAPVLDIRSQKDDNAFIGNRAFSDNAQEIIKFGRIYVQTHLLNNVIPVIKHYPGHGNINIDSHFFLPIVRNFSKERVDLQPFHVLMKEKVPAIMVGHILLPSYTKMKPATLSKCFITEFIRKQNRYNGLIITDELGMRAVRILYGKYYCMKLAFLAENDIISCKYSKGYIERCIKKLKKEKDHFNLDYHFNKIIDYKKQYHFNDNSISKDIDFEKFNKKIQSLNEN